MYMYMYRHDTRPLAQRFVVMMPVCDWRSSLRQLWVQNFDGILHPQSLRQQLLMNVGDDCGPLSGWIASVAWFQCESRHSLPSV